MRILVVAFVFFAMLGIFSTPALAQQQTCQLVDLDNAGNNWFGSFALPAPIPSHPAFGGKEYDPSRPVAPGEVVTALVSGTTTSATAVANGDWPTILGGWSVTVNGVSAPIHDSGPVTAAVLHDTSLGTAVTAVTFQVRYDVTGYTANSVPYANIVLSGPGGCTTGGQTVLMAAVPALYGNGLFTQAVVQDAVTGVDGSHPLTSGWITVYGFGFGKLVRATVAGKPFEAQPNSLDQTGSVEVLIDGVGAPVSYAGTAPGTVGTYQVNAQVPAWAVDNLHPYRFGEVRLNGQLVANFQYAVAYVCPADIKTCPDGTSSRRSGADCSFSCPTAPTQ